MKNNVAIIGAGFSGITLAKILEKHCEVTVFEKSRGVGGRMATRYADPFQFDHGAQYFTAASENFREFLIPFIEKGVISPWARKHISIPSFVEKSYKQPCYVAAPKMTQLARDISGALNVKTQTEITNIIKNGSGWSLESAGIILDEVYDWVIMTAPAPQCAKLMPPVFSHHQKLLVIKMTGCYSLMMGFDEPLELDWDSCSVENSPIGWMAVNSSKPLRPGGYSFIAQSTNEWAETHMNDDIPSAQLFLLNEVRSLLPHVDINPTHVDTHRWRYAATAQSAGQSYLMDEEARLAVCGDWCLEGKVESAFISGYDLGHKILGLLEG